MRVTRAAARLEEEMTRNLEVETPLPTNPSKACCERDRTPLGDITLDVQNELAQDNLTIGLNRLMASPTRKPVRKTKGSKKIKQADQENIPQVLEDDASSTTSSAADEACKELLRPMNGFDTYQIPMPDHDRPHTPPSKAVLRARKQLSPKSHTPHFNPDIHRSPIVRRSPTKAQVQHDLGRRDSFLDIIETRSPAKLIQPRVPFDILEEVEEVRASEQDEVPVSPAASMASPVDSPLGTPGLRTRASRIEDSLEALDAMEDALDAVQKSLADVGDGRPQTAMTAVADPAHADTVSESTELQQSCRSPVRMSSHIWTSPAKPAALKQVKVIARATRPRLQSTLYEPTAASARAATPRKDAKPARPVTRPPMAAPKPAASPAVKPKPMASTAAHKPSSPAKSTIPAAKPAVKLASEVVPARIKAQREARLASNSAKSGSATPSTTVSTNSVSTTSSNAPDEKRKSTAPEVRLTVAARARISIARAEKPTNPINTPKTRPVTIPSAPSFASKATAVSSIRAVQARASVVSVSPKRTTPAKSPNKAVSKPAANTPAKRAVSVKQPIGSPISKVDLSPKLTPSTATRPLIKKTNEAAAIVTASPNDRAEAAKRARADAAERGRLASQKWAEAMKRKRASLDLSNKGVSHPSP